MKLQFYSKTRQNYSLQSIIRNIQSTQSGQSDLPITLTAMHVETTKLFSQNLATHLTIH